MGRYWGSEAVQVSGVMRGPCVIRNWFHALFTRRDRPYSISAQGQGGVSFYELACRLTWGSRWGTAARIIPGCSCRWGRSRHGHSDRWLGIGAPAILRCGIRRLLGRLTERVLSGGARLPWGTGTPARAHSTADLGLATLSGMVCLRNPIGGMPVVACRPPGRRHLSGRKGWSRDGEE